MFHFESMQEGPWIEDQKDQQIEKQKKIQGNEELLNIQAREVMGRERERVWPEGSGPMLPKGQKSKAPWVVWTDIADQLAFPLSCPLIYHDSVFQVKSTEGERSS